MTPRQIVSEILELFSKYGDRHYGENVSERAHALQTATFARQAGASDAVVAACLLHDVGHLLHDRGEDIADRGVDAGHEELGAEALAGHFVPEVVEPIRLHVAAKRYLSREPLYFERLSASSRLSLQLQGGPMTPSEADLFERHPHFEAAVQLRRFDDIGKVAGLVTPELETYRPLLESLGLHGAARPL